MPVKDFGDLFTFCCEVAIEAMCALILKQCNTCSGPAIRLDSGDVTFGIFDKDHGSAAFTPSIY